MQSTPALAGAGLSNALKYEPALDGLRGIAVLAVVSYHAYPNAMPGGWAGVDVFFVLSGYLITSILRNELADTGRIDFARFYIRRAIRLMPAFWCLLLFMLAVIALSPYRIGLEKSWLMAAAYLMNWNRAFEWWPQYYLGHTWSLSAEEQFYLIWPILFLFIRGRRPLVWIGAALVATLSWRTFLFFHDAGVQRVYNGLDTRADAILMGCALALLVVSPPVRRWLEASWMGWAAMLVGLAIFLDFNTAFAETIGIPLVALCASIIVILCRSGPLHLALSAKPLVFLGRISYGVYLWHYPLLELTKGQWPRGAAIAGATLMATVSYFTVERHFRRLKGRLDTRHAVRASLASHAVNAPAGGSLTL